MADSVGRAVVQPFALDSSGDLDNATGDDLLGKMIEQVLGTRSSFGGIIMGELRWAPSFGSNLELLRHRPNNATTAARGKLMIVSALERWVPMAEIVDIITDRTRDRLSYEIHYRREQGDANARVSPTAVVRVSI